MKINTNEILKYLNKHILPEACNINAESLTKLLYEFDLLKIATKISNGDILIDILILKSMIVDYYNGTWREIAIEKFILIVAALMYLVTPFDVVNDFLPIFGFSDDLSLIIFVIKSLGSDFENYRVFYENKSEGTQDVVLRKDNNIFHYDQEIMNSIVKNIELEEKYITYDEYPNEDLSDSFFRLREFDYFKLIYNIIVRSNDEMVRVSTKDIKRSLLKSDYFDYNCCVSVMINSSIFDKLDHLYKKPFVRIVDVHDSLIMGNEHVVTYLKNNEVNNIINTKVNIKAVSVSNNIIEYSISAPSFDKELVCEVIREINSVRKYCDSILLYRYQDISFKYNGYSDILSIHGPKDFLDVKLDVIKTVENFFK